MNTILKFTKNIGKIKTTPVLKNIFKTPAQKPDHKLVLHSYSGEYFPLYKNEPRRFRYANEYQTYD